MVGTCDHAYIVRSDQVSDRPDQNGDGGRHRDRQGSDNDGRVVKPEALEPFRRQGHALYVRRTGPDVRSRQAYMGWLILPGALILAAGGYYLSLRLWLVGCRPVGCAARRALTGSGQLDPGRCRRR